MNKKVLAQFISFMFHPVIFFLLMPFLVVYRQTSSGWYALKWQLFSSLFVFIAAAYFFWGKWRGYFSGFDIAKQQERYRFYLMMWIVVVSYLLAAVFFKGFFFPLSIIAGGIAFGLIVLDIITHHIKASNHMAAVCAFTLSVGLLYGMNALVFVLPIVPLIAWARLHLKRHTKGEIIIGALLGITITMITFIVGKLFYHPKL